MALKVVKKAAVPAAPVSQATQPYRFVGDDPKQVFDKKTVVPNALDPEDDFSRYYIGGPADRGIIIPPYTLRRLDELTQRNNTLSPCIEAMVTNIDGTDFDIVKDVDGALEPDMPANDPKIKELWDFFTEPWPGESMKTQRKRMRRDVKRTGNGYFEIVRNAKDDIVFLRHIDSKEMRLCRKDKAVAVPQTIRRKGAEVTVNVAMRFRRFVQLINGITFMYFKEFGCPLDLNKVTGEWAELGVRLPPQQRASEVQHFIDLPDAYTPYGVPSWVCEMPSVLGSRKAEEFNLEFFENGGVPPVMIILSGGVLSATSRKAVEQKLIGPASRRNRVHVLEMEPSGGSLDSPGTSKVTVERFGAERQNDSMFEKYDEKCETRIRRSFRLPPIFVGQALEYSFATAYASYTVAERQVFAPERDAFDEIITAKLIPALGCEGYRMRSRPMMMDDVTLKLQGIEIAQSTGAVAANEIVDAVNEASGLTLKVSPDLPPNILPGQLPAISPPPGGSQVSPGGTYGGSATSAAKPATPANGNSKTKQPAATPTKQPAVSKADFVGVLAHTFAGAVNRKDQETIDTCLEEIRKLGDEQQLELVDHLVRLHAEDVGAPVLEAAE